MQLEGTNASSRIIQIAHKYHEFSTIYGGSNYERA